MYTQCNHCKAIFRVTMKELTAAQGLLRCGECDTIFDAMKTLSTTLPEERRFASGNEVPDYTPPRKAESATESTVKNFLTKLFNPATNTAKSYKTKAKKLSVSKSHSKNWLLLGVVLLLLLLIAQLLYFKRNWLAQQPLTASLTQQICHYVGCQIDIPSDLTQLKLLSRNVYSHPNTPNVLTISLSIQNDGQFEQPYPLIEISFLNKTNKVVALRRFKPEEYIKNYHQQLMPKGVPIELVLNIADPGTEAVRFQFRFL